MPGAGDPILVDERQPALTHDLEVVAGDRLAPPRFLDPPAIADLDRLAASVPADRREASVASISTSISGCPRRSRVTRRLPIGPTGRHVQRASGRGASGSVMPPAGPDPRRRSAPAARAASRGAPSERPGARTTAELLAGGRVAPAAPAPAAAPRPPVAPLQAGEQQALDRLGVRGGLREALLDHDRGAAAARRPGPGEGERSTGQEAGSSSTGRIARSAASPRPVSWAASAGPAGGARSGAPPAPRPAARSAGREQPLGARRGRNGSVSSPRPGVQPGSLVPEPGHERRGGGAPPPPIRRRPKRRGGRGCRVGVSRPDG